MIRSAWKTYLDNDPTLPEASAGVEPATQVAESAPDDWFCDDLDRWLRQLLQGDGPNVGRAVWVWDKIGSQAVDIYGPELFKKGSQDLWKRQDWKDSTVYPHGPLTHRV